MLRPGFRWSFRVTAIWLAGFLIMLLVGLGLDGPISRLAVLSPPWLRDVALTISHVGSAPVVLALALLVMLVAGLARFGPLSAQADKRLAGWASGAMALFINVASAELVVQIIKHLLGRARPYASIDEGPFDFHFWSWQDQFSSFPSGHTAGAFAAAITLSLLRPRFSPLAIFLACLVALSRIILSQHFPSDLVVGAALGSLISFLLFHLLARRLHPAVPEPQAS